MVTDEWLLSVLGHIISKFQLSSLELHDDGYPLSITSGWAVDKINERILGQLCAIDKTFANDLITVRILSLWPQNAVQTCYMFNMMSMSTTLEDSSDPKYFTCPLFRLAAGRTLTSLLSLFPKSADGLNTRFNTTCD
jgi:hypothetical protein